MAEQEKPIIVVKRIKKGGHGHHGGAWKIAYADFVTAMMAFFLLMWLLGSTTQGDLQGIADYFKTPLKVALFGGTGAGDASSLIKGGGEDLSRSTGQVKNGITPSKDIISTHKTNSEVQRQELMKLKTLKDQISRTIASNPTLMPYSHQLHLEMTSDGLRIEITDDQRRPMFNSGSDQLAPYTIDILHTIAQALNAVQNKITITGHTDDTPYAGGLKGYSNWELSASRANAARRVLVAGGINDGKILRVEGMADVLPLDSKNPHDPINRRISILVMTSKAAQAAVSDGSSMDINDRGDGSAAPLQPGK